MPHPSHRLDLYLVPTEPDRPPPADSAALWADLASRGWVDERGFAGLRAEELVAGGFVRARLDHPGEPVLYGNQQGGFRARCPACAGGVVRALGAALASWRAGGDRKVTCATCGVQTPLEGVDFQPAAHPARWAFVLADAEDATPTEPGLRVLSEHLGATLLIRRRA